MREGLITAILIIIMILNGIDVFVDIGLQVPFWHIVQEATLVLLSGLGAVLLIMHIRNKSQKLKNLVKDLSTANQQITSLTSKMAQERTHYSGVIKTQFEEWSLTNTEQQVALLILKGCSLKEIAAVRDTKEATVRQQASSVYSKSNLEGRHEFSAWFLEDFLN
ncbi:MAG: LuxR C-terminal-related transcriptional regulator [Glaciecola sp.]|jgi:DNA-binding NarL/FixJ family response regulator|nr:LuxR C-terminal-related transcriptional regulator [Glaciecola sp.]MDG1816359.1 LuxR C-terminal-related transcriptional regulator [Glaciecola sp.]MDG2098503.1 LuxR C-terminal-related transcriptional regulator [Glaciecola sp.]